MSTAVPDQPFASLSTQPKPQTRAKPRVVNKTGVQFNTTGAAAGVVVSAWGLAFTWTGRFCTAFSGVLGTESASKSAVRSPTALSLGLVCVSSPGISFTGCAET